MFKKLRNKLLVIHLVIIAALIASSFSVIYIITSRNIYNEIEGKLNGVLMMMTDRDRPDRRQDMQEQKNGEVPVPMPPRGHDVPMQKQNIHDDPFGTIMRYTVSKDGEVINRNTVMQITDEEFLEQMNAEILKIAESEASDGKISVGGTELEYKAKPFTDGYAVVIGEFGAEHEVLRRLMIILILVGAVALGLAFVVSLVSANSSIRPVEESYNKQKQFVADASHELKTPLTTIGTNVDVLLSHESSIIRDEKKWLIYIKNETERMAKLTNELLYLAGLDHNENVIYGETSFSEAVAGIILTMEAVAFERNITTEENIEENIYVKAAPEQLKQLTMILMDNAIKYTPNGGRIDISLTMNGKEAALKVRNTGEGIDKSDMKQIFERFYRSDKSRARESGGYGLGLAIAKALSERLGGEISVSSRMGEYTEFTVLLPAAGK